MQFEADAAGAAYDWVKHALPLKSLYDFYPSVLGNLIKSFMRRD